MKGFKAFEKGLVCRKFQFEEGKTFEQSGRVEVCGRGFHFCEDPMDVLEYYPLIDDNGNVPEFAEVEAVGEVKTEGNKSATNKIKIGAKLGLPGFIKASFDFLWERIKTESEIDPGNRSQLASSGYGSQLASSGDSSQLASSGYGSQLASSGNRSQLASSGDSSQLASSGDSSQLALDGEYSVGAAIADECRIKGKVGCWITLAEWDYDHKLDKNVPVCVRSAQIDGEILKADTWYKLSKGEFIAVEG